MIQTYCSDKGNIETLTLCSVRPSLQNDEPVFRGRKLVLNYTGGSLCSSSKKKRSPVEIPKLFEDDDDEDEEDDDDEGDDEEDDVPTKKKPSKSTERRKSTIISLLCESDPLAKSSVSFVAASPDDCTYFFEARSPVACGGIEAETQALSPGGVFGVIVLIAVLVYLVGGCVYQRTVMHQRGWRQLPNYTMWAGIWSFVRVRPFSKSARLSASRTTVSGQQALAYSDGLLPSFKTRSMD